MKISEYNKFKKHILECMTAEDLSDALKYFKTLRESNGTTYGAGLLMVQLGEFACYFDTVEQEMAEIYGGEFDRSRYYNKGGDLKYKNGECYIWTIYKHKIARALEMMERKGEL